MSALPHTIIAVMYLKKKMAQNAAWTAASNIIVRILGLLYRIWLSRAITNMALGLFQLSMSAYMLFITPIASGLPNAVSSLSASEEVKRGEGAAWRVLRSGLRIAGILALAIGGVMLAGSKMLAGILLHDIQAYIIILALIPAVVLGGLASVPGAFLHARGRSFFPALSELLEQLAKIAFGVGAVLLLAGGSDYAMAAASAGAISCGGLVSYIFLRAFCPKPKDTPHTSYTAPLLRSAIPLSASRMLGSAIHMAVSSLLPLRLMATGLTKEAALGQYGILTGMAFPIVFLPTTLTSALCVVLLPDIAKCRAEGNRQLLKSKITRSLLFTAGVTACASVGIGFLAYPLGDLLYQEPLAGKFMLYLTPIIFLMGITQVSGTIMNALKLEKQMLLYNLVGGLLCLGLMYFLTALPALGIGGYILANTIQAVLVCLLNLRCIYKAIRN